jgi:hypothetical protein
MEEHNWFYFNQFVGIPQRSIIVSSYLFRQKAGLKGQCHEIFCFWVFSWISFPQAPEYTIRAVSNIQGWPPVSTTSAANFATSFTSVVDTGGKFATGVNDAGGKFAIGVKDTGGKQWEQYHTDTKLNVLFRAGARMSVIKLFLARNTIPFCGLNKTPR